MKVAEIKKTDDGKIAVRFKGKRKFLLIDDKTLGEYIVYLAIKKPDYVEIDPVALP
jgi:hypothetical protein